MGAAPIQPRLRGNRNLFSRAARDGVHPWAVTIAAVARRLAAHPSASVVLALGEYSCGVPLRGRACLVVWSRSLSRLVGLCRAFGASSCYSHPAHVRASMPPSGVLAFRAGATRCRQGRLFAALPARKVSIFSIEKIVKIKISRLRNYFLIGCRRPGSLRKKPLAGGAGGGRDGECGTTPARRR